MGVTRFPVSPTLLWWHYLYARSVSVCDAILRYRVIQVKRHSSHWTRPKFGLNPNPHLALNPRLSATVKPNPHTPARTRARAREKSRTNETNQQPRTATTIAGLRESEHCYLVAGLRGINAHLVRVSDGRGRILDCADGAVAFPLNPPDHLHTGGHRGGV